MTSAYQGTVVVFGTQHGKHHQAAAAFDRHLGARVIAPPDLDTDQFGTFTGETPRHLSPVAAARAKAHLAAERTGRRQALASEASYGPLPGTGLPGHEELLLFVDLDRDWEIVEGFRSLDVPGTPSVVGSPEEIRGDLLALLDTGQGLVVRPDLDTSPDALPTGARNGMCKGITSRQELAAALTAALALTGRAVVEPDLRAMHNPTRRLVLTGLAERMARRLATPCPACSSPGFGRVDVLRGLPCAACGTPSDEPRADLHRCPACSHTQSRPLGSQATADPRWCPRCNP